jgi:hypothetical protein
MGPNRGYIHQSQSSWNITQVLQAQWLPHHLCTTVGKCSQTNDRQCDLTVSPYKYLVWHWPSIDSRPINKPQCITTLLSIPVTYNQYSTYNDVPARISVGKPTNYNTHAYDPCKRSLIQWVPLASSPGKCWFTKRTKVQYICMPYL